MSLSAGARDLTGRPAPARRYWVVCDESKPTTNGSKWMYVSLVIVAEDEVADLVAGLDDDRDGYDGELHFMKVTQHHKAQAARRWLSRAMVPGQPPIRFHVLGIDTDKLQQQAFGNRGGEQRHRTYTRFFRSAVAYALKAHCSEPYVVTRVIHDASTALQSDDMFDWHAVWRLRGDHDLPFLCEQVTFVSSNHKAADGDLVDSTLVQLTDIILGAVRLCLDGTSSKQHQLETARHFLPLVERIADERRARNPKSSYGHVGRCSVSFFPRLSLSVDELGNPEARHRSGFYATRRPALSNEGQLSFGL